MHDSNGWLLFVAIDKSKEIHLSEIQQISFSAGHIFSGYMYLLPDIHSKNYYVRP